MKNVLKSKTRTGEQRYICKECGKNFILEGFKNFYNEKFKKNALRLYFEGNSSRAVSRILNIGQNTCLRWIRAYSKRLKLKKYKNER